MKKILSLALAMALIFCTALSASAASYDAHIPSDGVTYLSNGDYVYRVENKTFFHDISENETLLVIEKTRPVITPYASHTPADLLPEWIYFHTDGPYSISVNMNAINRIFQTAGNWIDVGLAVGLTAGVCQFLYEAANGNFNVNKTVWEIDDGYHYFSDPAYFHIRSYFYSNSSCTNLIDTDSFTYHG